MNDLIRYVQKRWSHFFELAREKGWQQKPVNNIEDSFTAFELGKAVGRCNAYEEMESKLYNYDSEDTERLTESEGGEK